MKLAFKITLTKYDILWNVNVQIATVQNNELYQSIAIGAGIRIGDVGQPNILIPLKYKNKVMMNGERSIYHIVAFNQL